jgi:hypothetical protein
VHDEVPRQADARGLVPDRIIDKPKTGFFNHAVDGWLRAQLDGRASDFLLADRPAFEEFISVDSVRRLVAERRGKAGVRRRALRSPRLEVWLSTFVARASSPGRARRGPRVR